MELQSNEHPTTERQKLLQELYMLVQLKDAAGDKIAVDVLLWAIKQILADE
jgi:hypothetical protein